MSKKAFLQKLLIKEAVIALIVVGVAVAVMTVLTGMQASSSTKLRQVSGQLNSTNAQLGAIRTQMEKSSSAGEQYQSILLQRNQENYAPNIELLQTELRRLKDKYRLSNTLRLTLSPDETPTNNAFSALNHEVSVRSKMTLSFGAMSDMHVFSFLQEFQRAMPGVVRVTKLNIERKIDINVNVLSRMTAGENPEAVAVDMEFVWAALKPKEKS